MNTSEKSRMTFKSTVLGLQVLALLLLGTPLAGTAAAGDDFWDALTGGTPTLNVRGRIEVADQGKVRGSTVDTRRSSKSYTIRTRLGYGTKVWNGASLFADFENVAAIAPSKSFDNAKAVAAVGSRTTIADPTTTQVNQAFMKYTNSDLLGTTVIGGRQRIKIDDDRFIGNVGWRQNEQTYDAALLDSSLGVDKLSIKYGFIGMVRRIYGNQGTQPDWNSRSHLINVSYGGLDCAKLIAFAYLLDFRNSAPGNSSTTFGVRLQGKQEINDKLKVGYQTSWAYQQDWKKNPANYKAHYFLGDVDLGYDPCGVLGVGFEMLGSDNGNGGFVTPLATGHKFNGWADVFLANGGANGLRDIYVYASPKLPYKLGGKVAYHHFRNDRNNNVLGNEIDVAVNRKINDHLTLLVKSAYFATRSTALADIYRIWLQATVNF